MKNVAFSEKSVSCVHFLNTLFDFMSALQYYVYILHISYSASDTDDTFGTCDTFDAYDLLACDTLNTTHR